MVPEREKPTRLSLRPMAALFICITCIVLLLARGGGWRIAGFILAALAAAAILGFRIFVRRVAKAREPDPQSTLKI
jgi:membrane protein implicated in regulation of membrane protease activity